MLETAFILVFVAFLGLLSTCGWVLILFLWSRGLSRGTRSFAAALLGSAGLMVPILIFGIGGGFGSEDVTTMLVAVLLLAGLIGLPTALLGNRKLERIGMEPAAVFE